MGYAQGARTSLPAGAGTRDLKTTLFDAANALGMLRGLQQEDSVTTFEFWATGTLTDRGQPIKVSNYRASVRFRTVPGMRVDFTSAASGQPPRRHIQVVAGRFAWNEVEPGRQATPTPEAAGERLLQLSALPQAVVKGAMAAGDKATLSFEGGRTTLTFPVAGVTGATLTATLDARHLIERVVTRLGEVVTETTYSDYGDWNEKDYKADILFPRRLIQKRAGITLLDLTVIKTNTYNPYVIMPVPDNVEKSVGGSS
jgi:hypothetical protein